MRVSTTYLHTQGVQNILDQQAKLVAEQDRISKGVKFTEPSDDPGAFSRIMSLDEIISQMTQHEENANYATQRLNLEEATLDSSTNVLIRIKELTTQAANTGTYGTEEQRIIAAELREKLQELLGYANTRDASGEYIFAGFQSAIKPFTTDGNDNYFYNGDQGNLALQIGTDRQVVANDSGADIFQLIRNGNGTFSVDANSTNGGNAKISTGSVVTPSLYEAEDFSIVFNEVAPTAGSYSFDVSALGSFDFSTDQVSFDVDGTTVTLNTDVTDAAGMASAIGAALGTVDYAVNESAGVVTIARTATGATSGPPVINNYNGDVDAGGAVIADFISGGTSITGTDSNIPPEFEYSVINDTTGATVLANQPYSDGGVIAFNGIEVQVSGEPADGDVFTVETSRNQDVFNMLSNLINSMEAPVSSDVRGLIGGDMVNNGFDVGDVIDFNMQFNDQVIPINFTVAAASNAAIANQIFTEISAVADTANPDGSVTIAGTTPGTDITFRLDSTGTGVEFISSGGVADNPNSFSITNLRDSGLNDATFGLTASGNTIANTDAGNVAATASNPLATRVDITAGLDLTAVAAADRTFSLEVNGVTQNVVVPAADYTNTPPTGIGDGTSAALLSAINTAINAAFGSQVATASESAAGGLALATTSTGSGTTITIAEAGGFGAANLFGAVIPQITVGATSSGANFFAGEPHRSYLSQQIDNALNNLNQAMTSIINTQTSIGGRLNAIDSQLDTNAAKKEQMQKVRSDIEDLDMAEAISNMTFQTTALQIAQQTFVKIQSLSLFNFI